MELAERGLCGEQLHGLLSGLLHVHLYLAPTPATACMPACACGALHAAGPPGSSPAGYQAHPGCQHCLPRRADAPEHAALANGHAGEGLGGSGGDVGGSRDSDAGQPVLPPEETDGSDSMLEQAGPSQTAEGSASGSAEQVGKGVQDAAEAGSAAGRDNASGSAPQHREGKEESGRIPQAPPAAACWELAVPASPSGAELLAIACLDLEQLQALPEGPGGGLGALDDAQPLPPNTLVLELSDGLYVHPLLALKPVQAQRSSSPGSGEGAAAGVPEPPVRGPPLLLCST